MATYQKTKAYEGAEDAKVRPPALDAQCIGADGIISHGYHEPDDGMPRGAAPRIDSGFTLEGGINRCTASASRSPAATSRTLRRYRTRARIRRGTDCTPVGLHRSVLRDGTVRVVRELSG